MLAAIIVFGPLPRHALGVRAPDLPGWFMYRGSHLNICVATFYDGDQPLDRADVLDRPPWNEQPRAVRNLVGKREVLAEAEAICEVLGPEADLRVDAACGRRSGWVVVIAREGDLCP